MYIFTGSGPPLCQCACLFKCGVCVAMPLNVDAAELVNVEVVPRLLHLLGRDGLDVVGPGVSLKSGGALGMCFFTNAEGVGVG